MSTLLPSKNNTFTNNNYKAYINIRGLDPIPNYSNRLLMIIDLPPTTENDDKHNNSENKSVVLTIIALENGWMVS